MPFRRFLIALAFLAGAPAAAQTEDRVAGLWWRVPSLPSPAVTAVAQDGEGFIWAGTHLGLIRTDGHRTDVFRPSATDSRSLVSPVVNVGALVVDSGGTLWVGTERGLCRRRPRDGGFDCTGRAGRGRALGDRDVVSLAVGPEGTLWAGTTTGLFQIHPETLEATPIGEEEGLPHPYVSSLALASDGSLWAGTSRGLAIRPPDATSFQRPPGFEDDAFISDLVPTAAGAVWVATRGQGIVRVSSEGTARPVRFAGTPQVLSEAAQVVVTLMQQPDGSLFAGTWGAGLFRVDPQSLLATPSAPASSGDDHAPERVVDLATDNEGNLWAATWEGLFVRSPQRAFERLTHNPTDPASLSHPRVTTLLTTPGPTLWVGTFGGGLNRCDPHTLRCRSYRATPDDPTSLCSDVVLDLASGPDGTVWAATSGGGVCVLNLETGTFARAGPSTLRNAHVYDVAPRSDSEVWLATAQHGLALIRLDGATGRWTEEARALQDVSVFAVQPGSDERVWAGTMGRGTCRGKPHATFTCDSAVGPSDARSHWTRTLTRGAGGVWAGGPDGLDWVPSSGTRRTVLSNETVEDPRVACIIDAESGLWASTVSGLLRIDRRSLAIELNASASGVPVPDSYYPACAKVSDDLLAFGTENGVILFRPSRAARPASAPTRITALSFGGIPADVALPEHQVAPLVVRPHEGGPRFHFATLSYVSPDARQYVYRLDGYDDRWHGPTADPAAAYPKLPPGSYTFLARPAFSPSASSASVPFRVLAPLWKRPWFLTLAITVVLAALATVHRARTRYLLRIESTRRQIADDLHDDVGSRLSALALSLDVSTRTLPEVARDEIRDRADQTRSLLNDLRDAVWVVDGTAGSFLDLIERVQSVAEALLPDTPVTIETNGPLDVSLSMTERRHLLAFAKEAIHNAARHGRPAHVTITVASHPDGTVQLAVMDDGGGFDLDDSRYMGHGLRSLRRRAEALAGTLDLHSDAAGTRVTVDFRPSSQRGWRDRVRHWLRTARTLPHG